MASVSQPASLLSLPNEILVQIATYLAAENEGRSCLALGQTCKTLRFVLYGSATNLQAFDDTIDYAEHNNEDFSSKRPLQLLVEDLEQRPDRVLLLRSVSLRRVYYPHTFMIKDRNRHDNRCRQVLALFGKNLDRLDEDWSAIYASMNSNSVCDNLVMLFLLTDLQFEELTVYDVATFFDRPTLRLIDLFKGDDCFPRLTRINLGSKETPPTLYHIMRILDISTLETLRINHLHDTTSEASEIGIDPLSMVFASCSNLILDHTTVGLASLALLLEKLSQVLRALTIRWYPWQTSSFNQDDVAEMVQARCSRLEHLHLDMVGVLAVNGLSARCIGDLSTLDGLRVLAVIPNPNLLDQAPAVGSRDWLLRPWRLPRSIETIFHLGTSEDHGLLLGSESRDYREHRFCPNLSRVQLLHEHTIAGQFDFEQHSAVDYTQSGRSLYLLA